MNAIGQLGAFYNLTPEVQDALAKKAGMPATTADMQALATRWNNIPENAEEAPAVVTTGSNAHSAPAGWTPPPTKPVELNAMFPLAEQPAAAPAPHQPAVPVPWNAPQQVKAVPSMTPQQIAKAWGPTGGNAPEGPSASAPAPVVVRAQWQPSSRGATIQEGIDPAALEQSEAYRDSAAGHALLAADKHLEAASIMGQVDAAYSASRAAAEQNAAHQLQAIDARRNAYVADEQAKLDQLNAAAQKQVDPQAFWKERGTGVSVLAAVMMGLGQFASMWKGGTNGAMQIINDAVDKNIDAQKANIANARGAFADRMNLYHRNLEAFGDEERAALATKGQYLEQVASLLDQKRADAKTTEAQAAYHEMSNRVMTDRAANARSFAELTSAKITRQQSDHFNPAHILWGGAPTAKREGNLATTSDGTTYHFGSEQLAQKAVDKFQTLGEMQNIANRIVALRTETADLPLTEVTKRNTNILQLKKLTSELEKLESAASNQGIVTKADHEANAAIGISGDADLSVASSLNPFASSNREATNNAYRDMVSRWNKTQTDFAKAAGGEIYNRTYTRGADNQLHPTGNYTGQDTQPTSRVAPRNSKPVDSRIENLPTASAADRDTTPYAPVVPGVIVPPNGGRR